MVFMVFLFFKEQKESRITGENIPNVDFTSDSTVAKYSININPSKSDQSWYEKLILKMAGYDTNQNDTTVGCKVGDKVVVRYTAPGGQSGIYRCVAGLQSAQIPYAVATALLGMHKGQEQHLELDGQKHSIVLLEYEAH